MRELFQRWVWHNFGLKLLSVALASGLWLLLTPEQKPAEMALRVPIEFLHVPEGIELSSALVPDAQVRLRGPEITVRQIRNTDLQVVIDLQGVTPGERTFDLTARQVRAPRDLEIIQVIPGQVHLDFDTRMTRTVEIRPRVVGTFATGRQIEKIIADPATIPISGPQGRVQKAEFAITDPVDASGVVDHATFVTNAYVSDPLVQVVKPVPVRVTVIMRNASANTPQP